MHQWCGEEEGWQSCLRKVAAVGGRWQQGSVRLAEVSPNGHSGSVYGVHGPPEARPRRVYSEFPRSVTGIGNHRRFNGAHGAIPRVLAARHGTARRQRAFAISPRKFR